MACPVCLDLMWCAMPELEVFLLSSQPCLCARSGHNVGILPPENHLQPFGSVSTMDLLACPEAYPVQAWSMEALHWYQEGTQELVHHRCKAHVLDLMDILESLL